MELHAYDLICIGGGGAAALAAIHGAAMGKTVALVSKDPPGQGNTRLSIGRTAVPGFLPGDSGAAFLSDVLESGAGLSEPSLVETLAAEAAHAAATLEKLGPLFRREAHGGFSPALVYRTGGQSQPRSMVNLGGGPALGAAFRAALGQAGIPVFAPQIALELVQSGGRVSGVLTLDLRQGRFSAFACRAVLLATGGCSALYGPHTSNYRGATGDGLALALRAGAVLWDMEQIQYIPFGLTHPRSMIGALCGEPSTAGPAGRLLDGAGKVLLEGRINRLTRAAVTRVMMEAIAGGRMTAEGGLLLDLAPNLNRPDGDRIYRSVRASGIFESVRLAYGIKAYRWQEPWSVLPTAHFQLGGIRTGTRGETGVPGLYAAGEVQAGVHGGNRIGSAALSEIFVFGPSSGRAAAMDAGPPGTAREHPQADAAGALHEAASRWKQMLSGNGRHQPQDLKARLGECLWRLAGPVREEHDLLRALSGLEALSKKARSLAIHPERICNRQLLEAAELHLALPAAKAIVLGALERRESRGAHLRSDYPETDDGRFRRHTFVRMEADGTLKSGLANPAGS